MTENSGADIQLFYAGVLDRAAKLGFLLLLFTFGIYISGVLNPYLPLESLPHYWGFSTPQYLEAARIPSGWAWLSLVHHGDFLNFVPIAILAGVTILAYLTVVSKFFRNGEIILGMMALLQIAVLVLAASGILKTGGH